MPVLHLCRLGQLLAEKPIEDEFSCSQAQAAIPAVVSMAFNETNTEILKHLCTCPNCRKQLYLHRERIRKELLLNGALQNGFPCESVSATDIYDYCLPYGIDPADDQYVELRESLTSHLRKCPTCLAKIQELHLTVYNIAERAESDVVTTYNIGESAETQSPGKAEPYVGFPINVEIKDRKDKKDKVDAEQPPSTIDFAAVVKKKAPALNLKPLFKAGLAAAAVIAIGVALLFNAPAAKAVTIQQIYRAIENAKNVYITTFNPGKTEPTQERWVSRSSNIYMTKTGGESVLLDLTNKVRIVKHFSTGSVEESVLQNGMATETTKMMAGFLGLVPFADASVIPDDAEWKSIEYNRPEATNDTNIYELTWTENAYDGSVVFQKWRAFVYTRNNLPKRIESYMKRVVDGDYTLRSAMEVEYLSDIEMGEVVKKASF